MNILKRHLASRVQRVLSTSRVVNIVGPRQAGKTTLVRDLIETAFYATLDDDAMRAALESDAHGQLQLLSETSKGKNSPVGLDEIQRLPEITLALKRIVDAERRPGQFILTGTSDIFTTAAAYDSLAGRIITLRLRPFSAAELVGNEPCALLDALYDQKADLPGRLPKPAPLSRALAVDLIVRGGFPEIRGLGDFDRMERYQSYLDSIIERDVAPVSTIRKPDVLRRLIDQLAAHSAEEMNVAKLSRVLGVRTETLNDYIDILSRLGIVYRLGAWTSSEAKREIKASKLHFLDTGCATALRGEDSGSFGPGVDPTAFGHLFESFVFIELEKSFPFLSRRWRLYHWRLHNREIDLIAEAPGKRLALFEMKATSSVSSADFRHMEWFRTEGPGQHYRTTCIVIYLGREMLSFGPRRVALPLSMLWSFNK